MTTKGSTNGQKATGQPAADPVGASKHPETGEMTWRVGGRHIKRHEGDMLLGQRGQWVLILRPKWSSDVWSTIYMLLDDPEATKVVYQLGLSRKGRWAANAAYRKLARDKSLMEWVREAVGRALEGDGGGAG